MLSDICCACAPQERLLNIHLRLNSSWCNRTPSHHDKCPMSASLLHAFSSVLEPTTAQQAICRKGPAMLNALLARPVCGICRGWSFGVSGDFSGGFLIDLRRKNPSTESVAHEYYGIRNPLLWSNDSGPFLVNIYRCLPPLVEEIVNRQFTPELSQFFRKILVFVKFLPAILGPEMAAPILWTPGKKAFFLQEKPMSIKFLVLGGGVFWGFLGGGGKC